MNLGAMATKKYSTLAGDSKLDTVSLVSLWIIHVEEHSLYYSTHCREI